MRWRYWDRGLIEIMGPLGLQRLFHSEPFTIIIIIVIIIVSSGSSHHREMSYCLNVKASRLVSLFGLTLAMDIAGTNSIPILVIFWGGTLALANYWQSRAKVTHKGSTGSKS